MTKDEKIDLIQKRIRFLTVWKEISIRRKAFEPMLKIFDRLESDYDKCIIPSNENERIYVHFKSENQERIIPTKLGKYLFKNYKDIVPPDHILSDFVATLNSLIWKERPSIMIYKGEDIILVYKRSNQCTGVTSCMTRDGRHNHLEFLALNPNKVEIHCYEDMEKIYARALVWTTDDGKKIVDRIYPNNGTHFYQMLEHFKSLDNHYIKTTHIATNGHDPVSIDGVDQVFISMKGTNLKKYPYLDTMRYGHVSGDFIILSNKLSVSPPTTMVFNNTYGDYSTIP